MHKKLIFVLVFIIFSLAYIPAVKAAVCVQPPSGLVGWWPGDGNANDIWDGNSGTLMNGVTFAPGKVGQAFSFDGVDDYVEVPYDPSFNLSSFTLEAWVKFTQNDTNARIISHPNDGNPTDGYSFFTLSNALGKIGGGVQGEGQNYSASVSTVSFTFADDNWHMVNFVRDIEADEISIYVDGILYVSLPGSSPGDMDHNFKGIIIGSTDGTKDFFEGLIDEVEIYNRALNASEIQAIYNADSAGKCKAAVVCGDTITENTVLQEDYACSEQGFIIGADDVTLDCNGHSINGSGDYIGILADHKDNVVIQNCIVENFAIGIWFNSTDNGKVSNNNVSDNVIGVRVGSENNLIDSNTLNDNGIGFDLAGSFNNITSNTATENGIAMLFSTSRNSTTDTSFGNVITNNNASNNGFGYILLGSSENVFDSNIANQNTYEGFFIGVGSVNNIFVDNTAASNTVGFHSASSSDNVFTQNAVVGNSYGLMCDGVLIPEEDLLVALQSYQSPMMELLAEMLQAMHDQAKSILQNMRADGPMTNETIIDNTIEDNDVGVAVYNCTEITIQENNIQNNSIGIGITGSNNTINNNTLTYNGFGISITSSNMTNSTGNNITSNYAGNNYVGFISLAGFGNTFTDNAAENNSEIGFLSGSADQFFNNTAIGSNWSGFLLDLSTGGTPHDINSLVQFVLRENYQMSNEVLESYASKVEYFNEQKKVIRDYLTNARNTFVGNVASFNTEGFGISSADGIELINNTTQNNTVGINMTNVTNISVINNTINNNFDGISVSGSSLNTFDNNQVTDNINYGVNLQTNTNQNTFVNNFFSNNGLNAFSLSLNTNIWSTSTLGNIWSDYQTNIGYPDYYQIETNNLDLRPNYMEVSFTLLEPLQTTTQTAYVYPISTATFTSIWPGSDVVMTLITPSGRIINRSTNASDVTHINTPTSEIYEIDNPEEGDWDIQLFGADVASEGEGVDVSVMALPGDFDFDGYPRDIDCDDNNAEINPSAKEICDSIDNNCDGIIDDVDEDQDLVNDCFDDKCLDSLYWEAEQELKPNHYDSINWPASDTNFGCSCEQVLYCKPGSNNGEFKFGCSQGTKDIWEAQSEDSWALECQIDGIVAMEGVSKPWFENTDDSGLIDALDGDNDNDGIPDSEDDMVEDSDPPGDPDYGIPDWHPKSKHKK